MIRVLLADDHALVRRGVRQLLEPLSDITVVGEVENGTLLKAAIIEMRPHVLLLDVSMPGSRFLETLESLRSEEPRLRILVLSMHAEELYARRAIRAGAAGYISKDRAESELVTAIRTVGRGDRYISSELALVLADELATGAAAAPHESLTNREHEIMLLLASGHTVTQIAEQLGLSVKTVSTHRTRLLAKMALSTNADLARYAISHGMLA